MGWEQSKQKKREERFSIVTFASSLVIDDGVRPVISSFILGMANGAAESLPFASSSSSSYTYDAAAISTDEPSLGRRPRTSWARVGAGATAVVVVAALSSARSARRTQQQPAGGRLVETGGTPALWWHKSSWHDHSDDGADDSSSSSSSKWKKKKWSHGNHSWSRGDDDDADDAATNATSAADDDVDDAATNVTSAADDDADDAATTSTSAADDDFDDAATNVTSAAAARIAATVHVSTASAATARMRLYALASVALEASPDASHECALRYFPTACADGRAACASPLYTPATSFAASATPRLATLEMYRLIPAHNYTFELLCAPSNASAASRVATGTFESAATGLAHFDRRPLGNVSTAGAAAFGFEMIGALYGVVDDAGESGGDDEGLRARGQADDDAEDFKDAITFEGVVALNPQVSRDDVARKEWLP